MADNQNNCYIKGSNWLLFLLLPLLSMEYITQKDTYIIEKELPSRGQAGRFLQAQSKNTGMDVQIRLLPLKEVKGWNTVKDFNKNSRLTKLHHSALSKRLEHYLSEDTGMLVIVDQMPPGKPLSQFIDFGFPIAGNLFKSYLIQMLEALHYLHDMVPPLVHGHITPEQIFLDGEKLYLTGLSDAELSGIETSVHAGGVAGFAAPEQQTGRLSPRSDLYSAGLCFLSLAANSDLSNYTHDIGKLEEAIAGALQNVPSDVRPVLKAMTRHNEATRIESAEKAFEWLSDEKESFEKSPAKQRIEVDMPERFKVDRTATEMTIRWRWFTATTVFLTFFALIWNGFMIAWYTIAIATGVWVMALFGVIHLGVGFYLIYTVLTGYINKTTMTINPSGITIKHGPIPAKGNKVLNVADIKQLYCVEKISKGKNGSTITYQLNAITDTRRELPLIKNLTNSRQARYLEQTIEDFLNIRDEAVSGEYEGRF